MKKIDGGVGGLLFGNPDQLWIQAVGIGVAGVMGFGGTDNVTSNQTFNWN